MRIPVMRNHEGISSTRVGFQKILFTVRNGEQRTL
jgi:hypothetical protein